MTPLERIELLNQRLRELQHRQEANDQAIRSLQRELQSLKAELSPSPETQSPPPLPEYVPQISELKAKEAIPEIKIDFSEKTSTTPPTPPRATKKSLEQYIGGNLINKIGILILIVGIGLFVKYAIDNGYFPPLLRLILSFAAGLTLMLIGYRLKAQYKTYSAVLFSGGIVVLYLSAYAGYAYFDPILLPHTTSFLLMVIFTVVTVIAATIYDLQIVGLLGLVGAYAVPFLLSDGSGNYRLLFAYLLVINTGVLLLSLRKTWRTMTYMAFGLSWIILISWYAMEYRYATDYDLAWLFGALYFALFYFSLTGYSFLRKIPFNWSDIGLVILNSFFFYGLGMLLLEDAGLDRWQGLFTIANGALHLLIGLSAYRFLKDKKLFYLLVGLFFLFLTLAFPIQFSGPMLPVLWMGEAVLLYWLARRFDGQSFSVMAMLVLSLGCFSLVGDWMENYYDQALVHLTLIFNPHFLVSLIATAAVGAMLWIDHRWSNTAVSVEISNLLLKILLPTLLYFLFYNEIYHAYEQAWLNSPTNDNSARDWHILQYSSLWRMCYTLGFFTLLGGISLRFKPSEVFKLSFILISFLMLVIFFLESIPTMNALRRAYISPGEPNLFPLGMGAIGMRYICYLFLAGFVYILYRLVQTTHTLQSVQKYFPLVVHFTMLVFLSNELTTIMQLWSGIDTSSIAHQVGWSILWAIYSLLLIFIGFRQKSSILRIAAIVLFGVTLLKVFLLDLADASTISKTIVFIALGILLLIISYLYQRYKEVLLGEE